MASHKFSDNIHIFFKAKNILQVVCVTLYDNQIKDTIRFTRVTGVNEAGTTWLHLMKMKRDQILI